MIDRTQLDNSFEFIVLAGARARQLMSGSVPRITGPHKLVTIAQREVLSGLVKKVEKAPKPAANAEVG